MGFDTGVSDQALAQLSQISHALDERLNRSPDKGAPYVGERAFSHKGGLHVSAVEKDPKSYEHVPPESVGNRRHVVVSDQSGKSNILAMFRDVGIEVDANDPKVIRLVEIVKEQEYMGYAYDGPRQVSSCSPGAHWEMCPTTIGSKALGSLTNGAGMRRTSLSPSPKPH